MKQSRRSRRMARGHTRHARSPGFNLVSLMDIFTILVFFLLVNSSDGEVLPTTRNVELPESVSEEKPRHNLVVMVNDEAVLIHGKPVALLRELERKQNPLLQELTSLRQQTKGVSKDAVLREVTIMGSKNIAYSSLKQVMAVCSEAGFERISLAVLQKPVQEI